jgi:hypothetical protein
VITSNDVRGGDLVGDDAAGAARVGGSEQAGQSGAAVVALPHLRWRRWRFPAAAVITAEAGRWQVMVRVCRPATLLKATQAFNPLAKQRSYSAVKS